MLDFRPDPRYQAYWRHFRTGRFWDAHEVLEGVWLETQGPEREFYQGLIQIAAALHHLGKGNQHGAQKLAGTAREKLIPFGKEHGGVQLEALLLGVASCLADAAADTVEGGGARLRVPRVDLALGLDPISRTD